jgi:hypothetical protein
MVQMRSLVRLSHPPFLSRFFPRVAFEERVTTTVKPSPARSNGHWTFHVATQWILCFILSYGVGCPSPNRSCSCTSKAGRVKLDFGFPKSNPTCTCDHTPSELLNTCGLYIN